MQRRRGPPRGSGKDSVQGRAPQAETDREGKEQQNMKQTRAWGAKNIPGTVGV